MVADNYQRGLLKQIAEALNDANDVDSAMSAILPLLGEVMGLSTAWAFRYDPGRQCFVEVGASGLPPALACDDATGLKTGWCDCQDRFVRGKLEGAVNIVRCSRLRDAVGDTQGLVYHASVPLRSKGKPLGILNVAASGHSVFTEPALQLLTAIGHQVAVAVDRAGLLADMRLRAERLRAVNALSANLFHIMEPSSLLQQAVNQFVSLLHYEACGIYIGDGTSSDITLITVAHRDDNEEDMPYLYTAADETEQSLPEDECILLPNPKSAIIKRIPNTPYTIRLESSRPHAFTQIDEEVAHAFAVHLTAALENVRVHQQSLATAQWVERRRLAADLHDSVSQRLFSALYLARAAQMTLSASADETEDATKRAEDMLRRLESLIAESQEEMRGLIRALKPNNARSFTSLLRDRVAPFELNSPTQVLLTTDECLDGLLTPTQSDTLLKVLDEALQNVLKHACAKHAYVTVTRLDSEVTLTIRDDGIGFAKDSVRPGLGSTTMRDRIKHIGGNIRVHSVIGEGTTITCHVPYAQEHVER